MRTYFPPNQLNVIADLARHDTVPRFSSDYMALPSRESSVNLAGRSPYASNSTIQLSLQGSAALNPPNPASIHGTDEDDDASQQRQALKDYLDRLVAPHRTPGNASGMDAFVDDRLKSLMDKGYTADTLKRQFDFARRLDDFNTLAAGAVRSIPFGAAHLATAMGPEIAALTWPAARGAAGGALTFLMSHVGGIMLTALTAHQPWMAGRRDKKCRCGEAAEIHDHELADPMESAVAARAPSLLRNITEDGIAYQSFPAAFLVAAAAASVAAVRVNPETGTMVDKILSPLASPAAGAMTQLFRKRFAERDHRVGPAHLLASDDWEARVDALAALTFLAACADGLNRLGGKFRENAVTGAIKAWEASCKMSALLKVGIPFTGGFILSAVAIYLVTEDMARRGRPEHDIFAARVIIGAASLIPITLVWSTLNHLGEVLDKSLAKSGGRREPESAVPLSVLPRGGDAGPPAPSIAGSAAPDSMV